MTNTTQQHQTHYQKSFSLSDELWDNEKAQKNYNIDLVKRLSCFFKKTDNVIDFGAGIGTLASAWENITHTKPTCIEIDPELQKVLKKRDFICYSSIQELNKRSSFDGVYTSNVLEHIENDVSALSDIHHVLKENGTLVIFVPAFPILFGQLDKAAGHYRRYTKKDIIHKLNKTHFDVVRCEYAESIGFFVMLAIKLFGYKNTFNLGSQKSMRIYDQFIYPLNYFLDKLGLKYCFGKNLLVVAKKKK